MVGDKTKHLPLIKLLVIRIINHKSGRWEIKIHFLFFDSMNLNKKAAFTLKSIRMNAAVLNLL